MKTAPETPQPPSSATSPVILVAVDAPAAPLVEWATMIARRWGGAELVLVHCITPTIFVPTGDVVREVVDAELREAERVLAELAHQIHAPDVHVRIEVALGPPENALAVRATELHAALIVCGAPRPHFHLFGRSVGEKLVRKSPCSVLTVPPMAEADVEEVPAFTPFQAY